jgi:putative phosphoribosyl transferase
LAGQNLGCLLFDLLTPREALNRNNVFDIPLLARRLVLATHWLRSQSELPPVPLGYFGASTGAAAALVASTRTAYPIRAIVSRGGRPDLAGPALTRVQSPTLLLVGGNDTEVIALNRQALRQLPGPRELVIIPGAGHLFAEPGTLEEVARLAAGWFLHYLGAAAADEAGS